MGNRLVKQSNTTYVAAIPEVPAQPAYCVDNGKTSPSTGWSFGSGTSTGPDWTDNYWVNPPLLGR